MRKILLFSLFLFLVHTTTKGEELIVQMTTNKTVGSIMSIYVEVANPLTVTTLNVDFGDGTKVSFMNDYGEVDIAIEGAVAGNTIKIYGEPTDLIEFWSLSQGLTFLDVSKNTALTELSCSENNLTSLDVSKNTALTYLCCSDNDNNLTSLDVSNNTALKELYCYQNNLTSLNLNKNKALEVLSCSDNNLTSLDVSENTALTELSCSGNNLTSLDVSNNTALDKLTCSENNLTSLDVSNNSVLSELNCEKNYLTFTSLPQEGLSFDFFEYAPQKDVLIDNIVPIKTPVDLSAEIEVNGNTTTFVWKKESGDNLVEGTDYTIADGVTTFLKLQPEKVYCEMINPLFPDLTLKTILTIPTRKGDELIVQLTSNKTVGSDIYCKVKVVNLGTILNVDFGDGTKVSFMNDYGEVDIAIEGAVAGNTIKIYGEPTDLIEFRSFSQGLTSLNLSNCKALEKLLCDRNDLSLLDLSDNTALKDLNCDDNNLTSLNLSNCKALEKLWCDRNDLSLLDLSDNTALKDFDCNYNNLTSLDVSKNTALTKLSCFDNSLTSLDVSNNTALNELYCGYNNLTSLDVSKNTALTNLYCSKNSLTSLDVSNNTALKDLDCSYNYLTSLDVSKNTSLKYLDCGGNNLTSLDLSKNPVLRDLRCNSNNLNSLDVSKYTALEILYCDNTNLTSLDVSNNKALTVLSCCSNNFTFTSLPQEGLSLESFKYAPQNDVLIDNIVPIKTPVDLSAEIEVNGNTTTFVWKKESGDILVEGVDYTIADGVTTFLKLQPEKVYCEMTNPLFPDLTLKTILTKLTRKGEELIVQMTTNKSVGSTIGYNVKVANLGTILNVDFGDGTLVPFIIDGNGSISGAVAGNTIKIYGEPTDLIEFKSIYQDLTSLDVSNCIALEVLSCYNNNLTSLNLSNCKALEKLWCDRNDLSLLDLSNNTALNELSCSENNLTSLDVSKNTALTYLSCSDNDNNLTSLDVSNNTALKTLSCYHNNLTSLNLSNCKALKVLSCSSNDLTSLDVSNNSALSELKCAINNLTSLDVSNNTALKGLSCSYNNLISLDVRNNTALEYLLCQINNLTSLYVSNNSALSELNCEKNYLSFSSLPQEGLSFNYFKYASQKDVLIDNIVYVNTPVDLSAEREVDGNTTTFVWKKESGNNLVEGTDYTIADGVTTFLQMQQEKVYCEMKNPLFPDLTLKTTLTEVLNKTGVDEFYQDDIMIFSANKTIIVDTPNKGLLSVVDLSGKVIVQKNIDPGRNEIPVAKNGIYIVTLSENEQKISKKIVVQ